MAIFARKKESNNSLRLPRKDQDELLRGLFKTEVVNCFRTWTDGKSGTSASLNNIEADMRKEGLDGEKLQKNFAAVIACRYVLNSTHGVVTGRLAEEAQGFGAVPDDVAIKCREAAKAAGDDRGERRKAWEPVLPYVLAAAHGFGLTAKEHKAPTGAAAPMKASAHKAHKAPKVVL